MKPLLNSLNLDFIKIHALFPEKITEMPKYALSRIVYKSDKTNAGSAPGSTPTFYCFFPRAIRRHLSTEFWGNPFRCSCVILPGNKQTNRRRWKRNLFHTSVLIRKRCEKHEAFICGSSCGPETCSLRFIRSRVSSFWILRVLTLSVCCLVLAWLGLCLDVSVLRWTSDLSWVFLKC